MKRSFGYSSCSRVYFNTNGFNTCKSLRVGWSRSFGFPWNGLSVRSFSSGTSKPFLLTDIGEGIAEVEILKWYKKEGDEIQEFDEICQVQSDKATVSITSPFSGVINKLHYAEGDMAKTGSVLMDVQVEDEVTTVEDKVDTVDADEGSRDLFAGGEVIPFLLTDIGEGIAEVEIMKWYKKEGDLVQEFDEVCQVQSDKATVSITSPYEGLITKLYYREGEIAKTGLPLIDVKLEESALQVRKEGTQPLDLPVQESIDTSGPEDTDGKARTVQRGGKVLATPTVRRLATQHGIDLTFVTPTGRDGRVLKGDILAFIANGGKQAAPPPSRPQAQKETPAPQTPASQTPSPPQTPAPAPAPAKAIPVPRAPAYAPMEDRREAIKGIRKAMVKSMTEAASVPWFGFCDEYEMDKLMDARLALKPQFEKYNVKLTYMPLILKATAVALAEYPLLNSSISADATEIIYHGNINLGVAMDTPNGLVVPNIKDMKNKSILDVAVELQRLQSLAVSNSLAPEDINGGTFTISNVGNIGGTYLSPIPLPSEVAIGAIGKIHKVPRFDVKGSIVAKHLMEVSWRADHRVIDGALIARFSKLLQELIENPINFLTHLR